MPMTKEEKEAKRKEQRDKLLARIATLETDREEMKAEITKYKALTDVLDGETVVSLLASIEELKAAHNQFKESIRRDKGGLYVPGLEDHAKDFNLIKGICAAASRGQVYGDTMEFEAIKAATEIARNTAGIDSEGGYFIPDQVIPDVITDLYADSVLLSLDAATGRTRVSLIQGLIGATVRIPKFTSGMVAYWIGEKSAYTVSEPSVGMVTLRPKKLGLATTMSEEMARMASYGFDALLRNDFRRVASAELDRVIMYGNGTDFEPRGVINNPDISQFYFETDGTTAPVGTPVGKRGNWTSMNMLLLALENANVTVNNTAAWISSPSFFRDLAQLRVLNYSSQSEAIAPYLAGLPPLTFEQLGSLIGDFDKTTQVAANQTIATTGSGLDTTYTDLFYGNWSEVIVGRWGGIEVLTDQGFAGSNWWNDLQSIKMRLYMDIGFRQDASLLYARDARVFSSP